MGNLSELDKLYSPSAWSKRGNAEWIIKKHLEFTLKESDIAKQTVPCELNIQYGELEDEKYDLFGTDLPSDAPILIYIHGGYWQDLNKNISSYMVAPLYKNKIKVIVIGYTLCPQVKVFDIMQQIKKAVLKCIKYGEEQKAKYISIVGHSAGAQLAISLFSNVLNGPLNHIKSVYLIGGVYDLIPLVDTYCNELLLMDKEEAKKLSPLHQTFEKRNQKTIINIIVGENDSPAFVEQSKLFYNKLKDLFKANLHVYKNLDHFDIVEMLNEEDFAKLFALLDSLKGNS